MKRALLWLALVLVAAAPTRASGLGFAAAYWDTEDAGEDVGISVQLEFNVSHAIDLELRGSALDTLEAEFPGEILKLDILAFDLGISYNFARERAANPYLGGGVTHYILDVGSEPGALAELKRRVDDEFGWYVEAGVEIAMTKGWAFFLEGIYREVRATVQGEAIGDLSVRSPLELRGPAANAGVMFRW